MVGAWAPIYNGTIYLFLVPRDWRSIPSCYLAGNVNDVIFMASIVTIVLLLNISKWGKINGTKRTKNCAWFMSQCRRMGLDLMFGRCIIDSLMKLVIISPASLCNTVASGGSSDCWDTIILGVHWDFAPRHRWQWYFGITVITKEQFVPM